MKRYEYFCYILIPKLPRPALVVLELDVETVFDAHFHFDVRIDIRVARQGVHDDVHLTRDVRNPSHDRHFKEVAENIF